MVADTLKKETIIEGFQQVATPEQFLPSGVLAYRIEYEDFLRRTNPGGALYPPVIWWWIRSSKRTA